MKWRVTEKQFGWVVEYNEGTFSTWRQVINKRRFSFEPATPATFSTKEEAEIVMAKTMAKFH